MASSHRFDAGEHWTSFGLKNLANVAVRDIFIQPDQNDILIATHGRGLYILDDATAVQESVAAASHAAYLFPVRPALRFTMRATRAGGGDTEFAAPNPAYGATISYYLREPQSEVKFEVFDAAGKSVRVIAGTRVSREAGLHRTEWDLRGAAPFAGAGRGGAARGPQVLPGEYTVKMTAGSATSEQKVRVDLDPELKASAADLKAQWDALGHISTLIRGASASPDAKELSRQLQSLYGLVESPNDAPTPTMMSLLAELEGEYKRTLK